MDSKAVFELIRHEHPQIISILLAYLDSDQAAEVLTMFTDRDRVDLILRMSTLDSIQPTALQELNGIMEKHFSGKTNMQTSSIGGVKSAANVLNFIEASAEGEIIDSIKEMDPELAERIEDLMFVFDNLIELDDRSIQALLREVSTETLILALKGADEDIKEKIFGNMSKRAAEMLRDDLDTKGPVRLSEVEMAQKEILAIARRMAESGEINLGGSGEQYV
jgi:flagellar motor switch protein FliG